MRNKGKQLGCLSLKHQQNSLSNCLLLNDTNICFSSLYLQTTCEMFGDKYFVFLEESRVLGIGLDSVRDRVVEGNQVTGNRRMTVIFLHLPSVHTCFRSNLPPTHHLPFCV